MSAVVEAGNENKNGGRSQKNKKRHKFVEAHSNQSGTRKTGQHGRTQKKMKPSRNKNDRRWALPGVGHRHTIRHPSSADAVRIVRRPSFVFCLFFFCFFLHLDKSIAIRHPRRLTILIDNSFSLSLSLSLSLCLLSRCVSIEPTLRPNERNPRRPVVFWRIGSVWRHHSSDVEGNWWNQKKKTSQRRSPPIGRLLGSLHRRGFPTKAAH